MFETIACVLFHFLVQCTMYIVHCTMYTSPVLTFISTPGLVVFGFALSNFEEPSEWKTFIYLLKKNQIVQITVVCHSICRCLLNYDSKIFALGKVVFFNSCILPTSRRFATFGLVKTFFEQMLLGLALRISLDFLFQFQT